MIVADKTPYDRRSPMEHERDMGPVIDPASMVQRLRNDWMQPGDEMAAADMIEKLSGAVALFRAIAIANSDVVLRLPGTNETIKMGDFLE
jgi:hypothetical protein